MRGELEGAVWDAAAGCRMARAQGSSCYLAGKELLLKEALHISLTSEEQHFNRDVGLELQGCWVSTLKALRK